MRRSALVWVAASLVTSACGSHDDPERAAAHAEARVYADEGARATDRAHRDEELARALQLANARKALRYQHGEIARIQANLAPDGGLPRELQSEQRALLEHAKLQVKTAEDDVAFLEPRVAADRAALERLKEETERALAAKPAPSAELSRDVLQDRLAGVVATLAELRKAAAEGDKE